MRNWRSWVVAVLLFWPLVTIFILGSRWSGRVVELLSPSSVAQLPVSPRMPVTQPQAQPPQPSAPSASVQSHQNLASVHDRDRGLADEFWREYLDQPEP